jgi:hypothetical protein
MVGRELPNLRPHGEDHRGAGGGGERMMLRNRLSGTVAGESWRRLIQTTRRILIHKALVWYLETSGL